MSEHRHAIRDLTLQVVEDLFNFDEGAMLQCVLIERWSLVKKGGGIQIRGEWNQEEPVARPPWLEFSLLDGEFHAGAPANNLLDTVALIFEVWKLREDEPSISIEDHLVHALAIMEQRWRAGREPLRTSRQMGLIGEVISVCSASEIVGRVAVDSWDPDSRALYDIDSDGWVIEAKATRSDPETVTISDPHQVDFTIHKPILFSVTRMNQDDDGATFPQIIDELLSTMDQTLQSEMLILLQTQGYSEDLRSRFQTKWIIHGTRYIPITEDSPVLPVAIFNDSPTEVDQIKYRLNTSEMEEIELRDFLE